MNTFFTVWFLVNGVWHANVVDGWDAYDKKTEAACQASLEFAKDPKNRLLPNVQQMFTCEKDGSVKQRRES